MLGSITALLVALAMVPGHIFLEMTRSRRQPTDRSALGELMELLAVGLGTTGVAIVIAILARPRWVQLSYNAAAAGFRGSTDGEIRCTAALLITTVGLSILLAVGAGMALQRLLKQQFSPSVMQATLGLAKDGHIPVVTIRLADGSRVQGVLHSYSFSTEENSRAIALQSPMARQREGEAAKQLEDNYYIALGADIRDVALSHIPDPPSTTK